MNEKLEKLYKEIKPKEPDSLGDFLGATTLLIAVLFLVKVML